MTPALVLFKGELTLAGNKEIYVLFRSNGSILTSHMNGKVGGCSPQAPPAPACLNSFSLFGSI